jgi:hypothetical protein
MWETKKERKKRIEELEENITQRTKDMLGEQKDSQRFKELQKEIKKCKSELRNQRIRIFHLKAMGAVGFPTILLTISLFFAAIGISFFYGDFEGGAIIGIIGSVIFCGTAMYSIYMTISAVERAALRTARTIEFEICYESGEIEQETRLGQETELAVSVGTEEEDLENMVVKILFPPEIELKGTLPKGTYSQLQPEEFDFPNYNLISTEAIYVSRNEFKIIKFTVLGKKIGKYVIPVAVRAKGIYEHHGGLYLTVV